VNARTGDAHPGFLDSIVDLVHRPEHAIGDLPKVATISLELLSQPFPLVHLSHFLGFIRHIHDE
jgi:hypothetical protein